LSCILYFVANHSRHVQLIELKSHRIASMLLLLLLLLLVLLLVLLLPRLVSNSPVDQQLSIHLSTLSALLHVHATIIQFDLPALCFVFPSSHSSLIAHPLNATALLLLHLNGCQMCRPWAGVRVYTCSEVSLHNGSGPERGPKPEVDLMRLQFANPFSQRIITTYRVPPPLLLHTVDTQMLSI